MVDGKANPRHGVLLLAARKELLIIAAHCRRLGKISKQLLDAAEGDEVVGFDVAGRPITVEYWLGTRLRKEASRLGDRGLSRLRSVLWKDPRQELECFLVTQRWLHNREAADSAEAPTP